jgi:signal transduction histidine kinase
VGVPAPIQTARQMPAPTTPTKDTGQLASASADAIEIFADVLAQSEDEGLGEDFYSRLCEGITRCTAIRRLVIFRYDSARRRVHAAGAFGVDLSLFSDDFFTVESAALARRSLEEDRVLEITSDLENQLPAAYIEQLGARAVVCVPMSARGRWTGVILGERGGDDALSDGEREVLWILGKMAALASMARAATRQYERAVQLEARIDLAREVHESVVQRLFGVSLALSGDQALDGETRRRCAEEIQQALGELRTAIQRPLGRPVLVTKTTLREEVARLRHEHPDLGIELDSASEAGEDSAIAVPAELEPLAQSVLAEAIRNAHKHSSPTRVGVRTELRDGAFVLEVTNDGVSGKAAGIAGMGLRLAGFEALQAGGLLEFGARDGDRWQVRLVVPYGSEKS